MNATQQTIAAKNSYRASAGLRVLHYHDKIAKSKSDAELANRGEQHSTHARDYAAMVTAFAEAEAAHVDYLLLQGKMPGDGNEHDAWLSVLRQKVEDIDEPPDLQPAITGAAVALGVKLEAIGADLDSRLARLKVGSADLAGKPRAVVKKQLEECITTRALVQDTYVSVGSEYMVALPADSRAEASTKVKAAVAGWSGDIATCRPGDMAT